MGRRPQPLIRGQLLDACTDWALRHGLPDRLAPLAEGVGTSPRMLLYHFGTRDALLREVVVAARRRQVDLFVGLLQLRPDESYLVTLRHAWTSMAGDEARPYLRMFAQWRSGHSWSDEARRSATTDWLEPLTAGLQSLGQSELATLTLAVIRGLLMDLDATGGAARADAAFEQFLHTIGATAPAV